MRNLNHREGRNISRTQYFHNLRCVPAGLFHRADVTFVTKSADPDSVLTNLSELFVGDAINLQQQALQPGTFVTATELISFTFNHLS